MGVDIEVLVEILGVGIADDKDELGEKHDDVGDGNGEGVVGKANDKGIGEKHEQVGEHCEGEV